MRRPNSRACVAQSESEGSSEGSGISDSDSEGTIEFKKAEALTRRLERRKQRRALRGEGMTLTQEGVAKPAGFLDMAGPRGSQPLSQQQRGSQRASSQRGSQQPASQRGSQRSSQGGYSPSLSPVPGGSQAGRGSGQSLASSSASEQEERLPQQTDPATGGTLNWAVAPDYVGFNLTLVAEVCAAPTDRLGIPRASVVSWCETCVYNDGQVDELTEFSFAQANVAAMGPFDWVALVFATVVVALTINGELKVCRE